MPRGGYANYLSVRLKCTIRRFASRRTFKSYTKIISITPSWQKWCVGYCLIIWLYLPFVWYRSMSNTHLLFSTIWMLYLSPPHSVTCTLPMNTKIPADLKDPPFGQAPSLDDQCRMKFGDHRSYFCSFPVSFHWSRSSIFLYNTVVNSHSF